MTAFTISHVRETHADAQGPPLHSGLQAAQNFWKNCMKGRNIGRQPLANFWKEVRATTDLMESLSGSKLAE